MAREYAGGEAEFRVIGAGEDFALVAEGEDGHVVADIGKDGGAMKTPASIPGTVTRWSPVISLAPSVMAGLRWLCDI